ncbi:MAG: amidase [Pseudohongiella sp.]|uniref:amidase n=1 Tax=Pseudohongiella sp. TaxID=1979412 RepID=UPI0034A0756A
MPADITAMSATELSSAISARHVSCAEVMQAYLARIRRYNPVYNAIVGEVDDSELLQQARSADLALSRGEYRGWMHGMPHAVKDLAAVRGLIHTSASPMYADRVAEQDSPMVARLRGSGAIFVGKTNSPEFGLGSQTYNPVFGATGSAYDPDLTAGGSSGGAASALGTQMVPVADGSDMMGSVRNPGAFNNVIGFRPSASQSDGERSLSASGPMGRNTEDTIQLLHTMTGVERGAYARLELPDLRIGWLGDLQHYLAVEPGILGLCEANLEVLEEEGVIVTHATLPMDPALLWLSWTTLRHASRQRMEAFYHDPATHQLLKPELIWEIEQGLGLTNEDMQVADVLREELYKAVAGLFERYDFLVLPSSQVFPFDKNIHWPAQINGQQMDTYHRWMEVVVLASLAGLPVVNVPAGFDADGRPMGMQVIGPYGADKRVLEFALAYEALVPYLEQRPQLVATR